MRRTRPRKVRNLADWLQIALVAMLLQVLSPVLALHSMAAAASDGVPASSLCSAQPDSAAQHVASRHGAAHQGHDAACMACPFCSAVHLAIPTSLPAPPLPTVQGYVVHLPDPTASPRGPPLLRPKARGPPTLS